MSYFRSLLPGNTPAHIAKQGEFIAARERVLQTISLFLAGFGVVPYAISLLNAIQDKSVVWGIFFTGFFIATIIIALARHLPYQARAAALLISLLSGAVFSFFAFGLSGPGQLYLFAIVGLSGMLLGARTGVLGLVGCIVVEIIFMVGMATGVIPSRDFLNSKDWFDWLFAISYFLLLASTSTMTFVMMIRDLQTGFSKQKELSKQIEDERASLEKHIYERTEDLERRLVQIRTTVEINRAISSMLDPQALLQDVADLVQMRNDLYYAGVFLLDETGTYAVLKAGTGEAGQNMLRAGHRLLIGGSSMIGWTIANREARIALDVGSEAVRFNNPNLPLTRSELALPIIAADRALGAMTIQSLHPNAFDENDILVFQSIADSLGVALENSRLFQQTQQDLDEIRGLNRQYLAKAWNEITAMQTNLGFDYENPVHEMKGDLNVIQIPITLRDQMIGQINLETNASSLNEEEMALVEAITTQTALALESARLLEETRRRAAQEEKINELTSQFSQAMNIEEILKSAIKELGQLPLVQEVSVHLMPPDEQPIIELVSGNGKSKEFDL